MEVSLDLSCFFFRANISDGAVQIIILSLQNIDELSTYLHKVKSRECVSHRHVHTGIQLSAHSLTQPTYDTFNLPTSQNRYAELMLLSCDEQPQV